MFRRLDPVQHRDRFRHELKMDRDEFAWRQRREMNEDKREDRARELRLKAQQQQATAAQRAADQREKEAARAEAAAWSRPVTRYTGGTSRGDRHLGEPLIVEHFALPVSVAVLPPVGSGAPPLVSAAEVFLDADPALRDDAEWISTVGKPVHAAFKTVDQRYGGLLSRLRDHNWWRDVCKAAGVVLTSAVDEPRKTPRGLPVTRKVTTHDLPTITDLRIAEDGLRIRIGARVGDTAARWAKGLDTLRAAFKSAGANASKMRVIEDRAGNVVLVLDDAPSTFPKAVAPPAVEPVTSTAQAAKLYPSLVWPLGVDSKGKPITATLDKFPHVLVAGSTGGGKSVWLRTVIEALRLQGASVYVADGKRSDYVALAGLPGIRMVSTEPAAHTVAVAEVYETMESRREEASRAKAAGEANPYAKYPPILLVLDEFATMRSDWVGLGGRDKDASVADMIAALLRVGREPRCHVILSSQDIYVENVPQGWQDNMPMFASFGAPSPRTLSSGAIPERLRPDAQRIGDRITRETPGRALYVDRENFLIREVQTYYGYSPGTTSLAPKADPKVAPPTPEVRAAWELASETAEQVPWLYPRVGIKALDGAWRKGALRDIAATPTVALTDRDGNVKPGLEKFDPTNPDWLGAERLGGRKRRADGFDDEPAPLATVTPIKAPRATAPADSGAATATASDPLAGLVPSAAELAAMSVSERIEVLRLVAQIRGGEAEPA
ncbi:MAG TPA: FtsK/SpoIIIE domain-containing protein, partial [Dehalococcoidia bacterium]|nr:FtsK/SpoIIIE domain-containing protein [Dehalococcoidia bacterium]